MKRKILALVLSSVLSLGAFPCYAEESVGFADVPLEHDAFEAVTYLTEQGIINGISKTEFAPDASLKREEFAKILSGAFKLTDTNGAPVFLDVPYGAWYGKYTALVGASGLMTGVSESEFGVGENLSRQDLAVILMRFADKNAITLNTDNTILYEDSEDVSDYAKDAVSTLSSAGVMTAENGSFYPLENATRADTAQAVYSLMTTQEEQEAAEDAELPDIRGAEKLIRVAPEPFDIDKLESFVMWTEDFEDTDYEVLEPNLFASTQGLTMEEGYNSKGSYWLENDTNGGYWQFFTSDLVPGDYITLRAKVKTEKITTTSATKGASLRIAIYNGDTNTWMAEGYPTADKIVKKDSDWTDISATMAVPMIMNADQPSQYKIMVSGWMSGATGKAWYDDFTFEKTLFKPMETVLMSPNYKGLVYGDGGIGDIRLKTYVLEMGGAYDLSNMHYRAEILDVDDNVLMTSESDTVTTEMEAFFSSDTLEMGGDYYLRSTLTDKTTGEEIQRQEWTIRKREKDYRPLFYVDEHGRAVYKGTPEITMRMYNTGGGGGNYEECLNAVKASLGNVDTIDETGFGRWDVYLKEGTDLAKNWAPVFELAEANNIRLRMSAGGFCFSDQVTSSDKKGFTAIQLLKRLKIQEDFVKDMPALEGYYMFDEQNTVMFGEDFKWENEALAACDMDHPTSNAIDDLRLERPGVNAKTSDILFVDEYPLNSEGDDIGKVYTRVANLRRLNPGRPIGLIAQAFRWANRGNRETPPTEQEFRNMLFQALCVGVCQLDAYAYHDLKVANPESYEEDYAGYMRVYGEIGKTLEPIYLSIEPAPYYDVRGEGEWLKTFSKRYNGKSYLFAVNRTYDGGYAKIYLDGVKTMTGMYSGKTYEADEDGWFAIDFEGIQTEVFIYDQADYKSPHAELKYFGFMNDKGEAVVTLGTDGDEPYIKVSECRKELDYSALISENAQLYLNGEAAENIGTVNIENQMAVTVKVVSEDGRFSSEKTYKIERSSAE